MSPWPSGVIKINAKARRRRDAEGTLLSRNGSEWQRDHLRTCLGARPESPLRLRVFALKKGRCMRDMRGEPEHKRPPLCYSISRCEEIDASAPTKRGSECHLT